MPSRRHGAPGAPPGEPFVSSGPTELVSGLYVAGGPFEVFPGRCRNGVPGPGTITVTDPRSGTTVAAATVAEGQLATIPLAPGSYTIDGTFTDATINGKPMTSSASVTIPPGKTVRQDVVAQPKRLAHSEPRSCASRGAACCAGGPEAPRARV